MSFNSEVTSMTSFAQFSSSDHAAHDVHNLFTVDLIPHVYSPSLLRARSFPGKYCEWPLFYLDNLHYNIFTASILPCLKPFQYNSPSLRQQLRQFIKTQHCEKIFRKVKTTLTALSQTPSNFQHIQTVINAVSFIVWRFMPLPLYFEVSGHVPL